MGHRALNDVQRCVALRSPASPEPHVLAGLGKSA